MAKQNEVTAQSMIRRARAHRAMAKASRKTARSYDRHDLEMMDRAVAKVHDQTAAILSAEAKEIRSHR